VTLNNWTKVQENLFETEPKAIERFPLYTGFR